MSDMGNDERLRSTTNDEGQRRMTKWPRSTGEDCEWATKDDEGRKKHEANMDEDDEQQIRATTGNDERRRVMTGGDELNGQR